MLFLKVLLYHSGALVRHLTKLHFRNEDAQFNRWTFAFPSQFQKASSVADGLGIAFGDFLVCNHEFEWVVVIDDWQNKWPLRGELGDRPDEWLEIQGKGNQRVVKSG